MMVLAQPQCLTPSMYKLHILESDVIFQFCHYFWKDCISSYAPPHLGHFHLHKKQLLWCEVGDTDIVNELQFVVMVMAKIFIWACGSNVALGVLLCVVIKFDRDDMVILAW